VFRRKARHFTEQPLFAKLWFVPVWILLGISKAMIFTFSFRRIAAHLGTWTGATPWVPVLSVDQENRAKLIGRTVQTIARYTPWNSNCFPQAITARLLLGLYSIPYAIYFGLMKDATSPHMQAHAWVASGRIRVTGGDGFEEFTVVGCFSGPDIKKAGAP
jgi:hypothetical protein